jgi:formamidopyrimidine-DNA glycosylase
MPELPEVEVVRRAIASTVVGQKITDVVIRNYRLRWTIPKSLPRKLIHSTVQNLQRRGKYLLFTTEKGVFILHLGMSGRVSLYNPAPPAGPHDHIDIHFANHWTLRYTDPRRFGSLTWTEEPAEQHPLISDLGPEPFGPLFTANYLYEQAQGRKIPVKSFLMNNHIVVGVGNVYANEALFYAKVFPLIPTKNLTKAQCQRLVNAAKKVLQKGIDAGGVTLNDFKNPHGDDGLFSQELAVYGREGLPCHRCHNTLLKVVINKRTTVYCPRCQPAADFK